MNANKSVMKTRIKKEPFDNTEIENVAVKSKPRASSKKMSANKSVKARIKNESLDEDTVDATVKSECGTSSSEKSLKLKSGAKREVKVKKELESSSPQKTIKKRSCPTTENRAVKKIKVENRAKMVKSEVNEHLWYDYELLAESQNLSKKVAQVTVTLFEEGNTIPFIARYRKDVTENLGPEKLRDIKEEYDKILTLKARAQTVLKAVEKAGSLDPPVKRAILSARTSEELEHIYAPYKPGTKRSLAERAKALGLEKPALDLISGNHKVDLEGYIDHEMDGLKDINDVEKGVEHVIASMMATDTDTLSLLRTLRLEVNFAIETKKSNSKVKSTKESKNKNVDEMKFETYFDFHSTVRFIKPYQVLAINRGESLKILSVKIIVPNFVYNRYSNFCTAKWINTGMFDGNRKRVLIAAVKDSYGRLVQPYVIREIRSELKSKAEKASYEVFNSNLKQLLLIPPLKGKPILGIDPGFSNGCKLAVISETGQVLSNSVIYPHRNKSEKDWNVLRQMLTNHNCSLIALGNGTACRETEAWLTRLLQDNVFKPLDVTYTIINENGASIYSCSKEAKKEFPDLDPNIISAVSLARRLQDPLAELVKIEPKHLGVGMYQHDLPKKQLEQALDEVVMECVSFVGVDLNTASQCLLRRIAGLTDKRATQITEHRMKKGPFVSRKQLLDVTGIGPRVFQQCSGFLRVQPINPNLADEFYNNPNANKLDCTYVHPESYEIATKIINKLKLNVKDIGQQEFMETFKSNLLNVETLSELHSTSQETIKLIIDALSKPINFDLRSESTEQPLFKKGIMSMNDLKVGSLITGSVTNVTHFGCFVDIGVGTNGLMHQSKTHGFILKIGARIEVKVVNIDTGRNRIGLEMIKML